ncbi:MAG TPA: hypothetical protein VD860_02945 [Azospirillum sp.]|nr:hypothetical protein [Azospirillum sp.]
MTPHTRYDDRYDRLALANWVALIADDRGLDAAAVAGLAGLDVRSAQAILDGDVSDCSVGMLDGVLRAVERRPAVPVPPGPPSALHAGAAPALP